MGTHRESARSGDADDGEGAEVNGALPRRRRLVRDRDVLLGLGLVLRLGLAGLAHLLDFDRLGLLMHGASLGLCRVLDLERAGLVVSSTDAVVLPKGKGGGMCLGAAESICTRKDSMAGGMRTHGVWERWLARGEGVHVDGV